MAHPPYRDYLQEVVESSDPSRMAQSQADQPRAGHGTVFVTVDRHERWRATWQDDGPPVRISEMEGTRSETVSWALAQPAVRCLMQDTVTDDMVCVRSQL